MSTSELREAIQKIGSRTIQDYGDGTKLVVRIPDDQVDAILDAVIASLETHKLNQPSDMYDEGFNDAVNGISELLQQAKSANKESE